MTFSKSLTIFSLLILISTFVFAEEDPSLAFTANDEELSIHGLYLGMNKDDAMSVMKNWNIDGREVTPITHDSNTDRNVFSMGYDHSTSVQAYAFSNDTYTAHHYSAYDDIFYDDTEVTGFTLSSKTTNQLFNVSDMDLQTFAQTFVNSYGWIDTLDYNIQEGFGRFHESYELSNHASGWKIKIYPNKKIEVESIAKVSKQKNFE